MSIGVSEKIEKTLSEVGKTDAGFLVAVSAGVDSTVLARLLAQLPAQLPENPRGTGVPLRIELAHVDHGLRPESGEDAAFCRALAGELGVPFHLVELEDGDFGPGENIQAEARRLRRGHLTRIMGERGLGAVALAHHGDDQAETVLFRLIRGTGPRGVAGMKRWTPPFIRPLLDVRRVELEKLAEENGWEFREDPTNATGKYSRNRVRHELLPLAREIFPGADTALVNFASLAREDDDYLTRLCMNEFQRIATMEPDGVGLDCVELTKLEPPIARRLVLAACREAGGMPEALGLDHVHAVLGLACGGEGGKIAPTPGSAPFSVYGGNLWALSPWVVDKGLDPLPVMGETAGFVPGSESPEGALSIPISGSDGGSAGVELRPREPGDQLFHEGKVRKLKDLIARATLPWWRRQFTFVAVREGKVIGAFAPGVAWGGEPSGTGSLWVDKNWWLKK